MMPETTHPQSDPTALTTDALRREITHLRELVDERFKSVEQQFLLKDRAVSAALDAAKEAVAKNEQSTEKQIDRILETIAALDRSHTAQVTDLKERLDRGDGDGAGRNKTWLAVAAIIGVLGTLVGMAGAIAAFSR